MVSFLSGLVDTVETFASTNSSINFIYVCACFGSSEKLLKLTGYKPHTNLHDGLKKIYQYNYENQLQLK